MRHFTLERLCYSDTARQKGINNAPTPEAAQNLENLCFYILDPLWDTFGEYRLSSAYRSPKVNSAIRGDKSSQHMLGQAADITSKDDSRNGNLRLLQTILAMNLPFDQLINEEPDSQGRPNWIHVSFGPRHRRQLLTYTGKRYLSGIGISTDGLPNLAADPIEIDQYPEKYVMIEGNTLTTLGLR